MGSALRAHVSNLLKSSLSEPAAGGGGRAVLPTAPPSPCHNPEPSKAPIGWAQGHLVRTEPRGKKARRQHGKGGDFPTDDSPCSADRVQLPQR